MPQFNNQLFSQKFSNSDACSFGASALQTDSNNAIQLNTKNHSALAENLSDDSVHQQTHPEQPEAAPINSIMSELNRLSQSFADSYQNLEGQVEKLNGQLLDETEQKNNVLQEKQKLQGEKAFLSDRLQNLLAIMPAGVVVIDGGGKVKDCNAKAVDILGRPLLGELWVAVIKRVFEPQADDGHQVSLKDGRKIHIETRALDVEPGQLVVLTDLTKSRELQAELTQQQKLSSMGKMVASLAHQIRTPLSAAILYSSNMNKANLSENLKQEFSQQLLERLHFMERQIDDMLGFVRGERVAKQQLSIRTLYQKIESMQAEFKAPVNFEFINNKHENIGVLADQDALLGAIANLIENAVDACLENIKQNPSHKPSIDVIFDLNNKFTVQVKDNGIGISSINQKKIFDPFFTTKKSGNGLGLAIVHGIVIEHKGQIKVSNNLPHGSCFEINLPIITQVKQKQTLNFAKSSATSKKIFEETSNEY